MCDPGTLTIVATAAAVAGTITSTAAAVQQSRYEAKIAERNKDMENAKVADALQRGDQESLNLARKQSALAGAQRAAMAANGVDLGYGSAAHVLADTAMFNQLDQYNLRQNENREIMGYDINAANYKAQANAARAQATGQIISGALSTIGTIAGGAQKMGKIRAQQNAGGSGWG